MPNLPNRKPDSSQGTAPDQPKEGATKVGGGSLKLETILSSMNVAALLSDGKLEEIGQQVIDGVAADEQSRAEWLDLTDRSMEIAKQVFTMKSEPFEGAANIKFPLITQAVLEFGSRTFAEIVRGNRVAKFDVIGRDPQGLKANKAQRLTHYHNYQLLYEQKDWKHGVDKALHVLPMTGVIHRKVYYDEVKDEICSELCNYQDIIINHACPSLKEAPRITHRVLKSKQYLLSRMRMGLYSECDLETLDTLPSTARAGQREDDVTVLDDEQRPYTLLEQHCWLDLDGDDFPEPYIVIIHENTGKVLRIVARFDVDSVELSDKNEVLHIEPEHYFADWHCLPSPDGGYWSIGFGQLLYPINETVNSLINQLVDAGTLNNQQAGLMARQIRMKGGSMRFKLNEWKMVDVMSGASLKDSVFPLPTKEPSPVLFQLLGMMINVAKDLSSITDVLQGKQPAQNVAATTISVLEKQGLTLYNAMQKRLFYGLKDELEKIYSLVKKYVNPVKYQKIIGERVDVIPDESGFPVPVDFIDDVIDVAPVFDPSAASDTQRIMKLQQLMQFAPGTLDPHVAAQTAAEILQIEVPGLITPPPPPNAPPAPDVQEIMKKIEVMDSQIALNLAQLQKIQAEIQQSGIKEAEAAARIQESQARSMKMAEDARNQATKIAVQAQNVAIDAERDQAELQLKALDVMNESSKIIAGENLNERKLEIETEKARDRGSKKVAKESSESGDKG
jgi:chaperonin GroES